MHNPERVCKDYKWAGAKRTIDLVNNIRKVPPHFLAFLSFRLFTNISAQRRPRTSQEGFSTPGAACSHLSQSPDVTNPLCTDPCSIPLPRRRAALADYGVKLVCFPPHSDTTMRHYERALPAAFRDHVTLAPLPTPVHFATPDESWWPMHRKCRDSLCQTSALRRS